MFERAHGRRGSLQPNRHLVSMLSNSQSLTNLNRMSATVANVNKYATDPAQESAEKASQKIRHCRADLL